MLGVQSGVVLLAMVAGMVGALSRSSAVDVCEKRTPAGFAEVRGLLPELMTGNGPQRATFGGVVEERLNAGAYRYLRIRTSTAVLWLTTPRAFDPGTNVVQALSFHVAPDFYSRRLGRRFAHLHFGALMSLESPNAGASSPEMDR